MNSLFYPKVEKIGYELKYLIHVLGRLGTASNTPPKCWVDWARLQILYTILGIAFPAIPGYGSLDPTPHPPEMIKTERNPTTRTIPRRLTCTSAVLVFLVGWMLMLHSRCPQYQSQVVSHHTYLVSKT